MPIRTSTGRHEQDVGGYSTVLLYRVDNVVYDVYVYKKHPLSLPRYKLIKVTILFRAKTIG
jgi:hypothetical protein